MRHVPGRIRHTRAEAARPFAAVRALVARATEARRHGLHHPACDESSVLVRRPARAAGSTMSARVNPDNGEEPDSSIDRVETAQVGGR